MEKHRLWAGTVLVLAATWLQIHGGGGWAIALIALLGVLLTIASFAEGKRA